MKPKSLGENSPKTWNEMKIHKNFWVTFFLFVSLVIFQTYVKDSSIERTIYLLALLILGNLVITIFSSDKLNLKRTTKESRQQVGQYFKENYEIENNKRQPLLWASIIDESNITKNTKKKIIAWIPGFGKRNFVNQVQLEKRGVFSLGPTKVNFGDPFGMFSKNLTFQSLEKIVILPKYEKLKLFPDPSGSLTGGVARKTRNTEVSPYAISVRDYYPGDPLRRIDWKTTARLDKLMVKEFEEDPQATVWILLDGDEKNSFNSETEVLPKEPLLDLWNRKTTEQTFNYDNSFELAISVSASICDYYINDNRSLGFCSNGQQIISVAPEGGVRQLDKVLELLASLQNTSEYSIQELLLRQSNLIGKGCTIVLISSNTSSEFINAIKNAQKRNFSIILISIDPRSFNGKNNPDGFYQDINKLGIKLLIAKNKQPVEGMIN